MKNKRYVLIVPGFVAVLIGAGSFFAARHSETQQPASRDATDDMIVSVQAQEFSQGISRPDAIILDVRTAEEFQEGHITGAQNIDFYAPDFAQKLAELDRTATYNIYCRSGNRSRQTIELMRSLGFSSIRELRGGIVAWHEGGNDLCQNC